MKIIKSLVYTLACSSALVAGTHWGYTGHEGPQHWGDLSPKFGMCKQGKSQSPINISKEVTVATEGLKEIKFNYTTRATEIINNGHTIQINVKDGSSIEIDGKTFDLKQFHFHTPSENQIESKNFPLEAHFVHADKDGTLAVVALMYEDGEDNKVLKKLWSRMPHKAGESNRCIMPAEMFATMMPKDKAYYRFNGSLTTPPCSEGVRWMVLKNYSHVSKAQTEEFLHLFHHANNRPVQPINARKVMK
ncbi:carbonic anhydrase [Sulfurimonas sp.]|uniref:carbonic anhydrase n=1 Tax=Sulfurimonas sp. TaxID=2022749 RepID=UPI00356A99DA